MKRKSINTLLLLAILTINTYSQSINNKNGENKEWDVSTEERIKGLITIWSEVKFGFPYPEKLETLDWDNLITDYISKVSNATNEESYYKVLMEFTTLLQDSHTNVIPPWGYFRPNYDIPPFEIIIINDKFYISRVGIADDLEQNRIVPGIEILEVEDIPVKKYFQNNVLRYYTFGSKHSNEAALVFYLLYGPNDKKVNLNIKDVNGKIRNVALERKSTIGGGSAFMYEFISDMIASNIEIQWNQKNILYVKIPTLNNDDIANQFQSMIDTLNLDNVKGMVLDLRNNNGGSDRNSKKIVETLISEPVSSPLMYYFHHIAAHKAWGNNKDDWNVSKHIIQPRNGKRYLGKLIVLINAITSSSAEDVTIELKTAGRATIIGGNSEGGAGNTYKFKLPGGGTFRMATFKATFPDGTEYIGKGITPDIVIPQNINDIINGRDKALEMAVELITQE